MLWYYSLFTKKNRKDGVCDETREVYGIGCLCSSVVSIPKGDNRQVFVFEFDSGPCVQFIKTGVWQIYMVVSGEGIKFSFFKDNMI